jgi:hypothetical protein
MIKKKKGKKAVAPKRKTAAKGKKVPKPVARRPRPPINDETQSE